ncbi:ATP-binding protein [Iamia majanohamensis]|uniref:ATP-binding protein n=1 Tax=Iamia majanohamensis TaxID=467976 RepID=A0AAE9Y489_9ACTN|nr:ATP-binding protein [Iamia majanohamensis]WCO66365.1 ATP-binding protein [Iamia majanohamensis]
MGQVADILRCLSEVSTRGAERLDVAASDFAWLGTQHWPAGVDVAPDAIPIGQTSAPLAVPDLSRLAQLDALHRDLPILRLGWIYLVGQVDRDGARRRVVLPLVERPVQVVRTGVGGLRLGPQITLLGPWDLSDRVGDVTRADTLERTVQFGGGALLGTPSPSPALLGRLSSLNGWAAEVARAMGFADVRVVAPDDPRDVVEGPVARLVVGFGVHTSLDTSALDLRSSLEGWASLADGPGTALAAAYLGADHGAGPTSSSPATDPVVSPLVLSVAQEQVVRRARSEPLVVVSGPPGTGKSHTAAAVALDAVYRGERVLLATRSPEAADVLAGLLERMPGPDPVLFGGGTRAARLARVLGEGLAVPTDDGADARQERAWARAGAARSAVDEVLRGVEGWSRYQALAAEVPHHQAVAPHWFAPGADLGEARSRLATARRRAGGWRWRAERAAGRARDHAGATPAVSLDALGAALEVAEVRAAAAAPPPTVGSARWDELDAAEQAFREATGLALRAQVRARVGPDHTRAVAALATALRAGRSQRRRHLRGVDADWLTAALPLWVGTLGDIEELLPARVGMFDLVVLDEASQIDQPTAAVALLRARRAVVVGDPHQLRFVSFVADDAVARAVARHGLGHLADRLDVRRVSAFDLAAGATPVTMLDEHFRGPPHLIGFSARRFYDGRLHLATRHPATEQADCIEVAVVDGPRHEGGASPAEVEAVMGLLSDAVARDAGGPATSIGIVTPFRAQAEALTEAVRAHWSAEDIARARLRVGTVHAFQGDERDLMVLSLGVGADGEGLRFLEDPNLFNVLVTRARRRQVVVTSCAAPRAGLLHDYLRWAAGPPPSPADEPGRPTSAPWAGAVAAALRAGGVPVVEAYPVGREVVDLCVGGSTAAVGVETAVHPDGPAAHRRRHLALRRAGWQVVDAFPSRVDGDPVAAALDLATSAGRTLG